MAMHVPCAAAAELTEDRLAPTLTIFGPEGIGFLTLNLPNGRLVSIELEGRLVKVLLVLNDALKKDENLDERMRGWRTDRQIAEGCTRGDPRAYVPEPQAIRAYRSLTNRCIRRATLGGCRPPVLFRSKRLIGVRLVRRIVVIDLSQRRAA
jgi:hypothetical protein